MQSYDRLLNEKNKNKNREREREREREIEREREREEKSVSLKYIDKIEPKKKKKTQLLNHIFIPSNYMTSYHFN